MVHKWERIRYMYEEDGTRNAFAPKNKDIWWQMIQLLPSSYNLTLERGGFAIFAGPLLFSKMTKINEKNCEIFYPLFILKNCPWTEIFDQKLSSRIKILNFGSKMDNFVAKWPVLPTFQKPKVGRKNDVFTSFFCQKWPKWTETHFFSFT